MNIHIWNGIGWGILALLMAGLAVFGFKRIEIDDCDALGIMSVTVGGSFAFVSAFGFWYELGIGLWGGK